MQKQNSAFAARSKTASTKALVAYGGNVCESNTSKTFCTPRNGFEDRGAHRSPSVPKCGGILPNRKGPIPKRRARGCGGIVPGLTLDAENRNYFTATDKGGLAQGAQAAGILVEHRKAHGILEHLDAVRFTVLDKDAGGLRSLR